tara:strand:+ start:129 stop:599 length:471 start_codon:yes stop_codon:yes gene_type:complete
MKKKLFIAFIIILFGSSCGFKVINKKELINFDIYEIKIAGDKQINYKIKNKLIRFTQNNKKNLIALDIKTKKNRSVKERNINNEITKFEISIAVDIIVRKVNHDFTDNLQINKNGIYIVDKQYVKTLNNEKTLIKNIASDISDEIIEELILKFNDL